MALKLNFQTGGGGFQAKKSSMEGMWIFSGTTQWCYFLSIFHISILLWASDFVPYNNKLC